MSGYSTVQKIRFLEQELDKLGMAMTQASHYYKDFGDVVAIIPKDENTLPVYSRDAELFIGSLESLEIWIQGVQWARNYDRMVFGRQHEANRERREQNYRNDVLVKILSRRDPMPEDDDIPF